MTSAPEVPLRLEIDGEKILIFDPVKSKPTPKSGPDATAKDQTPPSQSAPQTPSKPAAGSPVSEPASKKRKLLSPLANRLPQKPPASRLERSEQDWSPEDFLQLGFKVSDTADTLVVFEDVRPDNKAGNSARKFVKALGEPGNNVFEVIERRHSKGDQSEDWFVLMEDKLDWKFEKDPEACIAVVRRGWASPCEWATAGSRSTTTLESSRPAPDDPFHATAFPLLLPCLLFHITLAAQHGLA